MTQPLPPNPTQLDYLLLRLNQMQEAVVSGSDAVPVWFYSQGGVPFWINKTARFSTEDIAIDLQVTTYDIIMRLVLRPVTSGIEYEAERLIHTWVPTIIQYFGKRRQLKRTSADTDLAFLDSKGALITGGNPDYNMEVSGIGQLMFGIDFNIEVPMDQYVDQVIF